MKLVFACLGLFLLTACATDASKVAATGPKMANADFDKMEARLFAAEREDQKYRESLQARELERPSSVYGTDKTVTPRDPRRAGI